MLNHLGVFTKFDFFLQEKSAGCRFLETSLAVGVMHIPALSTKKLMFSSSSCLDTVKGKTHSLEIHS